MLPAHLSKKFAGRFGSAGSYILITVTNSFNGFRKILAFPLQIGSQRVIQGCSGILAAPSGVFFQLCLTFRLQWNHIHFASLVSS